MKKFNRQKGAWGEDEAALFLQKKGYEIIERNFHTRFGEIDIIACQGNKIIFVEVKASFGNDCGQPWEKITRHKVFQVKRMGRLYLVQKNLTDIPLRVDGIGVWFSKEGKLQKITHWKNIY